MSKKRVREIEIPGDVLEEILARLPAKSLLRFACVSKAWSSLFRNPTFISKHLLNGTSGFDHALLNLRLSLLGTHDKVSLLESPPDLGHLGNLDNIEHPFIVGQCHGLICYLSGLKHCYMDGLGKPIGDLVTHLWNPAIGQDKILPKSNILPLPHPSYWRMDRFGFGYDPKSRDYKIVRFAFYSHRVDRRPELLRVQAEVYSLRTDSWRPTSPVVLKGRPDEKSIGVCLGGFCYWTGYIYISGLRVPMIISYDLSNEVLREYLVPELVHPYSYPDHVPMASKLFVWKGSLTLIMFPSPRARKVRFIDIWSFESGVDGPLTLKKRLRLSKLKHLDDMDVVTTALNDVEFLWNEDLILKYDSRHMAFHWNRRGTTLKAFNLSTRQVRNISSFKIRSDSFTLQVVGYTPSLVSLT